MTTARVPLPDGRSVLGANLPRTWSAGERLRSVLLEEEIGGAIGFHRERPLFQGVRTTALAVATSTWTPVPLDTELIDTHDGHGDTTNTSRYNMATTAADSDWYLVTGHIPYGGNATGVRIAGVRVNGGTVMEGMKVACTAAHGCSVTVIDLVEASLFADYVELLGWQNSGGSLNTVASGKTPSLTARWACGSGNVVAHPGTPRTWTAADLISASSTAGGRIPLNTHIRDVIFWLNNPPIARLTSQGTSQALVSGTTWTSIQFPAETVDNYGGHSNVTNNTRYTAQRAGLYYVAGLASISEGDGGSTNAGYRACRLLQTLAAGGTVVHPGTTTIPLSGTGSTGTAIYAEGLIRMAVGDYVELQMIHGGTGNRSVLNSAGNCSKLIAVWKSL